MVKNSEGALHTHFFDFIVSREFLYGRTNINNIGNISSRPINMNINRTNLPGAENPSTNEEVGPISPNPGLSLIHI